MKLFKRIPSYLKDLRFSSLFAKYFILLFVALVLPVTVINLVYQNAQRKSLQERLIQKNEQSLSYVKSSVDSVFASSKNKIYSISKLTEVTFLATRETVEDSDEKVNTLESICSTIKRSNVYLDSVGVWFPKSNRIVSSQGSYPLEKYGDTGWQELYQRISVDKIGYEVRRKNDTYPYLLTYLCPIADSRGYHLGAVFINIDLEGLGKHLGTGRYQSTGNSSELFIFEKSTGNLVYSDEYRYWQEEGQLDDIWEFLAEQNLTDSQIVTLWNHEYMLSVLPSKEGFLYAYLSPHLQTSRIAITEVQYLKLFCIPVVLCAMVAFMFAIWIYRPIRKTMELLDSNSMLVGWDEKNGLNEIESIQRSILHIKERDDSKNELLKERMLSLHNAQICALQTQINPHFLYNCLESIGNMTAIMMGGENQVTEAIYTLGKLMRISLSGRNYLVPLREELEHVNTYIHIMELIEPGFSDRIHLHLEIPEEMKAQRVIKLTLQPIIENALEHGLSEKRQKGNIWITGEIRKNGNFIYVANDGTPVSAEQLKNLRENLKQSSIVSSKHIGLRNVDQRLKLVFGDECGLSVKQTDKFTVTVAFKSLKKELDN